MVILVAVCFYNFICMYTKIPEKLEPLLFNFDFRFLQIHMQAF